MNSKEEQFCSLNNFLHVIYKENIVNHKKIVRKALRQQRLHIVSKFIHIQKFISKMKIILS